MLTATGKWQPTEIRRFVESFDTGAGVVLVETDAGPGYLKAIGNHSGEHVLACELVGTQLAVWFGLSTFDFSLIEVTDIDEIPLYRGGTAVSGPAFISRKEKGQSWSGKERELKKLVNPEDITRLVVFDTWTRNCDRRSPGGKRVNRDNVFLSEEAPEGQLLLKAMDHTHCFTCGKDLSKKVAHIGSVKDDGLPFGLFPEFRPFLDRQVVHQAIKRLKQLTRADVKKMTEVIPTQWDVSKNARNSLVEFIIERAAYLVDTIEKKLFSQGELDFPANLEE